MKLNPLRAEWVLPLVDEAAALFRVSAKEVLSDSRYRCVIKARQFAVALAYERYGWSYPELGLAFGLDPSTCITAVKRVRGAMPERLAWRPPAKTEPAADYQLAEGAE